MLSQTSDRDARRGDLVVAAMCCAVMVVVINTTSIGMAIPEMSRAIRADQTQVQWIVDSYLLVLAALLLPAGALLDRYGRRRGVIAGLTLGGLAYLACGFAGSPTALIVARCVAGVGAALVLPGTLGGGLRLDGGLAGRGRLLCPRHDPRGPPPALAGGDPPAPLSRCHPGRRGRRFPCRRPTGRRPVVAPGPLT